MWVVLSCPALGWSLFHWRSFLIHYILLHSVNISFTISTLSSLDIYFNVSAKHERYVWMICYIDISGCRISPRPGPALPMSPGCQFHQLVTEQKLIRSISSCGAALPCPVCRKLGGCDRNKKSGSCEHLIVGTQTRLAEHYDGTRHHSGRRVATAYLMLWTV